ncbi:hypothetical protein CMI37_35895 [Candidatus Pacearchaeota archaeon]|nr:hypothetical protein [Candidatus Pacearchaeota archaeon]|tara:strand:+ start:269 stop:931 length:663 start_codon:yes stop_codon:yes gene_type:complete
MIDVGSPHGLSEKILRFFISLEKEGGFFIEAGASNGIWQSNTYYLEKVLGWNGLLIEPNSILLEDCRNNRKNKNNFFYNCALVSKDYEKEYIKGYFAEQDYENRLMAQVENINQSPERKKRWATKSPIIVPAKKLSDILEEFHVTKIDFFSLDVEGYEVEVLSGLDFTKHAPTFICVECWNDPEDSRYLNLNLIKELLEKKGYELNSNLTYRDLLFEKRR